jgi:hypothetical protein
MATTTSITRGTATLRGDSAPSRAWTSRWRAGDADIIQIGQHDGRLTGTGITQWTVQRVLADGVEASARGAIARLQARSLDKVWIHVVDPDTSRVRSRRRRGFRNL